MKIFCISDSLESALGLKLAGVESIVLEEKELINKQIDEVISNKEIGILVVTDNVYELGKEKLDGIQKNYRIPLIVRM